MWIRIKPGAQGTEHRAQSTGHRAQSKGQRKKDVLKDVFL